MNYYNEIKSELINNEITKKVKSYSINKSDLDTYYNVGRILSEAGKHYGEGIIKEYSKRLTSELGKGYTISSLKRFRQFYNIIEKGATVSHQLTWSHYVELLPFENINIVNYYITVIIKSNLSVRELRERIKNKEYERLPELAKNKLMLKEKNNLIDLIKEPILIKNNNNIDKYNERALQKIILENLPDFLKELGPGFTFVDNEYRIKIGNNYNYIDLLLFNIEFNAYIVVELKVCKLKKEHIGQIQVYMNYIDENVKKINQDKTIGIIICKENNRYIMKYCSDSRIISKEYKLIN